MDPQMLQHRSPEDPKTLLESGCCWKLVSEKSCSRCGAVLFFANLASRAREPEIAPQMKPKSGLKRPPEAPECPKMSLQIGARISIKFQLRFWRFWSPKMAPKIAQKTASEPRARPGLILASIWALRGLMFELFRGARLLILACCSSIAGALFLLRPLLHCSPSEPPGYEAQVTKAIASWPRSLVASCLRSSGGRRQEGVAP